jgi:pimeloyl-ACP methyl ester carboxylesterase
MKLFLRILGVLLLASFVFIAAGFFATWEPDRSVQELSVRWAKSPSQFLAINGMQVHLRDEGPREDPLPIVLLHGTSASLHTWDGWVSSLAGQRRVIRFDLPAFGLTGPDSNNDYSIDAYVRLVGAVVDQLGVKSFVLAGNSLGGQVAWNTALVMPQRVKKLVLIDSAGYAFQPASVPIGFTVARIPGLRVLMEYFLPRGVVASSVRNVYGDPRRATSELIDRYYELTLRAGNRKALAIRMDQRLSGDESTIKNLKLPTLLLWGAKDRLIPLENAKRFESDIVGSQLVVFEDLGHVPQEENAQRTVEAFMEFLKLP